MVRSFNSLHGQSVQYKLFHKQLSKETFPEFMRALCERLMGNLSEEVLRFDSASPFSRFSHILLWGEVRRHAGQPIAGDLERDRRASSLSGDQPPARGVLHGAGMRCIPVTLAQVELMFKEWKSYANLHAFATENAPIAEGLIWAALCAAIMKRFLAHAAQRLYGVAISTRKTAMALRYRFTAMLHTLLTGGRSTAGDHE